jgi:hypothetical protein
MLFLLMLWKFWSHIRGEERHFLSPMLAAFYRDGTLFFFLQVPFLCPPHHLTK